MLEIVILYFLCKKIGQVASSKGYPKIGFQIMTILLWFGAEFATGVVFGLLSDPNAPFEPGIGLYIAALVAAACSAGVSFGIVSALADRSDNPYSPDGKNNPYGPDVKSHPYGPDGKRF